MKYPSLIYLLAIVGLSTHLVIAEQTSQGRKPFQPSWKSLDTRLLPAWWDQSRFGIMVCWGLYSVPSYAKRTDQVGITSYAEWYASQWQVKGFPAYDFHQKHYGPDFNYSDFKNLFKGELWDPDQWADLFARSGAKYVVLTAKYHDGFCLFPSKYTPDYNSVVTGPKRDICGELRQAVLKRNMRMGFYFSLMDWTFPEWGAESQTWTPEVRKQRRNAWIDKFYIPQLKELVTKYHPSFLFGDGEWDYDQWKGEEVMAWLYNESPVANEIIVNDRFGAARGKHGDIFECEYGSGPEAPYHPWQEDRGIGLSYGYNRVEDLSAYQSKQQVIQLLARCAGRGGNLLLDVGPAADGMIPVIMQERLVQIGEWLKVNGEAIYDTKANPFFPVEMKWGTITAKTGKLYLHVFGKPGREISLPFFANKINRVSFLSGWDEPVTLEKKDQTYLVKLPKYLPDDSVSVIEIDVEGTVEKEIRQNKQNAKGEVVLKAIDAEFTGASPQYCGENGEDHIGFWGNPADGVYWKFILDKPGTFDVLITYSSGAGWGGGRYVVGLSKPTTAIIGSNGKSEAYRGVEGRIVETGSFQKYATHEIGRLTISEAGQHILGVQPLREGWKPMGLHEVQLVPVQP